MDGNSRNIKLIRWDFRLIHIALLAGSAFLLYSALGLDDGRRALQGTLDMFILHRYVGLAWGILISAYGLFIVMRRRRLAILEPLRKPVHEQISEGISVVGRYLLNSRISDRTRSRMGRHNVMASYAFLVMLLGLVLLGVGGLGLILLAPDTFIYEIFLGTHILGAGFLSLFVVAHLFAVVNRHNRPLLRAVFTDGKVNASWVDETMPKYGEDN